MQDASQSRTSSQFGHISEQALPVETDVLAETDQQNPLAPLGNEAPSIHNHRMDRITELVLEHVHDYTERIALIVTEQVLDVLKKEGFGLLLSDNALDIEEKCSLR